MFSANASAAVATLLLSNSAICAALRASCIATGIVPCSRARVLPRMMRRWRNTFSTACLLQEPDVITPDRSTRRVGVEGLPLGMGLAADGGDVRRAEYPGVSSRVGVMRWALSDALACGPAAWDGLQARSASPSPFMTWAWHRAWADSASPDEAHTSEVLALNGPGGSLEALLPVRLGRV